MYTRTHDFPSRIRPPPFLCLRLLYVHELRLFFFFFFHFHVLPSAVLAGEAQLFGLIVDNRGIARTKASEIGRPAETLPKSFTSFPLGEVRMPRGDTMGEY